MIFTGKNRKDFEDWYEDNMYKHEAVQVIHCSVGFDELPLSMQSGVILEYLDSVDNRKVIADYHVNKKAWFVWLLKDQKVRVLMRDGTLETRYFTTRPEALTEAFKKANDLINEKE